MNDENVFSRNSLVESAHRLSGFGTDNTEKGMSVLSVGCDVANEGVLAC